MTLKGRDPKKAMMTSDLSGRKWKRIRLDNNICCGKERSPYFEVLDAFFRSKTPNCYTSVFIYDEIEKKEINTDAYNYDVSYRYDGFWWKKSDLYHFYIYNMPLSQAFTDYVLDQYKQGKFTTNKHGKQPYEQ